MSLAPDTDSLRAADEQAGLSQAALETGAPTVFHCHTGPAVEAGLRRAAHTSGSGRGGGHDINCGDDNDGDDDYDDHDNNDDDGDGDDADGLCAWCMQNNKHNLGQRTRNGIQVTGCEGYDAPGETRNRKKKGHARTGIPTPGHGRIFVGPKIIHTSKESGIRSYFQNSQNPRTPEV